MKKPEILAPAGNLEKLKIAVHYGADALYLGGKAFGLRNMADNFSEDEMKEGLDFCHKRGVKVYLTVNSYPHNNEIDFLERYLGQMGSLPFDAYIAADPGIIQTIQEISPQVPIHLSTQANTTNWKSTRFWEKIGISRINLAREMSRDDIIETRQRTNLELEVFVHGAMCISYSGRCLLSSVMSGRSANRGECAHPCRWQYALVEQTRPGEYFPVAEAGGETFIFNSKDLCLLQYLPEIITCGVDSLKIEGRMKGINYLASVLRVYRHAVDSYCDHPESYRCRPEWMDELAKISHRGYTTGFFLGPPRDVDHEYHSRYIRSHDFVAVVEEPGNGTVTLATRNRIKRGDILEFIGPSLSTNTHTVGEMWKVVDGKPPVPIDTAHPNDRVLMPISFDTNTFDLIRREKPVEAESD